MPRIFGDIQEGYGANVVGGAGGRVVRVSNLNDGGFGSLRYYLGLDEPRIVRFDVAGNIELESSIVVTNNFLTINGDDAPCGGVCLKNEGIKIEADEVIIEYLKVRPGPDSIDPNNNDCINIVGAENVMISHCSLSWSTDELLTISNSRNVTVQWCILSEGLSESTHPEGEHSKGLFITQADAQNISVHHNLIAHNVIRVPTVRAGKLDFRNNVIYNSKYVVIYQPDLAAILSNYVGNWFINGVDTIPLQSVKPQDWQPFAGDSQIYLLDNRDSSRTDDTMAENLVVEIGLRDSPMIVADEIEMPFIRTTNAPDALEDVLAYVGATLPTVDPIDLRILQDVIYGTGQIIDDPSEVGGWPDLVDLNCRGCNVFSWIGGLKN